MVHLQTLSIMCCHWRAPNGFSKSYSSQKVSDFLAGTGIQHNRKALLNFVSFVLVNTKVNLGHLKRGRARAVWVCFGHCALLIKNTWVRAKGIVMLATWPLQIKPGTQADLKFKAYLVWEHLLKKMSFVFRIITCNSSRTIFSPNRIRPYRGNSEAKKSENLGLVCVCRDQMATRYWAGFCSGVHWLKKTSRFKMTINFLMGLWELFKARR